MKFAWDGGNKGPVGPVKASKNDKSNTNVHEPINKSNLSKTETVPVVGTKGMDKQVKGSKQSSTIDEESIPEVQTARQLWQFRECLKE
ncbi:hypothetical protein GJU40_18045 [Bacillus lacus]|uniref:Uncharacterized protein n=1 Tax=Metabacillus lacus TaxID=1983721 RepID=A0A7X2J223_9BACI|nr:hypothetical protein [Metabacillus lacus]MRX74027.1 hypothetical protein [Metabacillus lacus]